MTVILYSFIFLSLKFLILLKPFFQATDWEKISEEAKTLIKKMLTYNPAHRLSAHDALNDSWIQRNAPSSALNDSHLKRLKGFYVIILKIIPK